MTPEEVRKVAEQLYYPHIDEWKLETVGDLKHIRYKRDYTGRERFDKRLARSFSVAFIPPKTEWEKLLAPKGLTNRLIWFFGGLKKEANIPDCTVNGNPIFWFEHGRYMMMVRPKVGDILAEFLTQEPENPYAQRTAAEMKKTLEEMEDW